ncbi:MAG: pre-rRNA processing protein [Geoglossum umbratile]|nr:MAG: pre-rRNA processing protein [Geoglossum umbratile]
MSSFFTVPTSQRKRKRVGTTTSPASKKRNIATSKTPSASKASRRHDRDESISGSESESDGRSRKNSEIEEEESTDSEQEEETAAEKRLRLAERYLENIREEVDETGFDAAEIDKDLIAERLKEDVAETKGRLYRRLTSNLSFESAYPVYFRADTHPTTSIATCPPYAYTVSKDMTLIKWRILDPPPSMKYNSKGAQCGAGKNSGGGPTPRRKPKQVAFVKGNKHKTHDTSYQGHVDQILAVAASQDGKFVVTGGKDRRLIVWNAADLTPLRVFTQHRDAVTGLAFRRGTNQLYSGSKDRTIKIWSLDELAYVETLFGHQDEVVDIAALAQERCVSVGARDRTARLWKVAEETQLVFRGGGEKKGKTSSGYVEGSIDRVAIIDEEMFVTGSDNGSLSLWVVHKKKPIFTVPLAHGLSPPIDPSETSAEQNPDPRPVAPPQPRWITALATIPYSDVILSGSWDGNIRAWKVTDDKKKIESLGLIGRGPEPPVSAFVNGDGVLNGAVSEAVMTNGDQAGAQEDEGSRHAKGVVTDISVFERGERGKDGICVVAALATEHRLGRWMKVKGKNGAVVLEVPAAARSGEESTDG